MFYNIPWIYQYPFLLKHWWFGHFNSVLSSTSSVIYIWFWRGHHSPTMIDFFFCIFHKNFPCCGNFLEVTSFPSRSQSTILASVSHTLWIKCFPIIIFNLPLLSPQKHLKIYLKQFWRPWRSFYRSYIDSNRKYINLK